MDPLEAAARLGPILPWLDLFGIAVFATTGALAATRRGQTLVTAAFFALITGVGGGSVRDLLIGAPVFWVHDPLVAAVCLAAAGLVWVSPQAWWKDKALAFGVPPVPAALMGVMTACVGGIIRDVLAGEPSILMRPELYVTAAALAAGLHVVLVALGVPAFAAAVVAATAGFSLRAAAIYWQLALPSYRGRR